MGTLVPAGWGAGTAACSGAASDTSTPQTERACCQPGHCRQQPCLLSPLPTTSPEGLPPAQPSPGCQGWSPSSPCHEALTGCPAQGPAAGMLLGLSNRNGLSKWHPGLQQLCWAWQVTGPPALEQPACVGGPRWYATALPPPWGIHGHCRQIPHRELSATLGGGGGNPTPPPAAAALSMGTGDCTITLLTDASLLSQAPQGPHCLQAHTRQPTGHHLARPSSRGSLPGPSVVAPCPALPPDPSKAETPATTPPALLH